MNQLVKKSSLSNIIDGIFFVNVTQRTKQPNRVAFFVRWGRHPLIESGSARPSGAAESGSQHSHRSRREIPGIFLTTSMVGRNI
jgi:hypothetical protein